MQTPSAVTAANRALHTQWPNTIALGTDPRGRPERRARSAQRRSATRAVLGVVATAVVSAFIVATGATATAALLRPKAAPIAGAEQMRRQAHAVQALRSGQYAAAYGRFAELADDGDGSAALMALALLRHGDALSGSQWSITTPQLERWSAIAFADLQASGRAIAAHDRGE